MDNGQRTMDKLPVFAPSSVVELSDLVHRARESNQALYPFGGRTMIDLGLVPTKPGTAVDMRGLNSIIDYPARDMTITLQAGITIAKLNDVLRAKNSGLQSKFRSPIVLRSAARSRRTPADPGVSGSARLRDYIIGISVVNDRGQEVKAGGRVVKNVAGYDLMKLYTGSLGTLGIISQVTLKLKPEPEASSLLVLPVAARSNLGGSRHVERFANSAGLHRSARSGGQPRDWRRRLVGFGLEPRDRLRGQRQGGRLANSATRSRVAGRFALFASRMHAGRRGKTPVDPRRLCACGPMHNSRSKPTCGQAPRPISANGPHRLRLRRYCKRTPATGSSTARLRT